MEILGVVFVLAFIVGFVVQTVMPMKKKADMAKLELLYFANQDTEVGKLAEEAIALIEKEQSLDSLKKIMQSQSGDLRAAGTGQSAEAIVPRIDPKLTQGLTPEQKKDIEALEQLTASKHGEYIQSLENLTRGASINPGDIAELENELRKSMELRNRQQQVGSAISAIQEWQKKMERRSQDAKDPLSAFR
ncbi:MAG: hypothetical protein HY673_18785 [Chloroflexi bacterium]|nr:hypothetical protein [Chloroflexota bacterium]